MGVDAVVGMALYLGRLKLPDNIPISKQISVPFSGNS
jgi:hypothetical protein